MTDLIPAPQPITAAERELIARVEGAMRPAFVHALAHGLGPYDRPTAEIAERMEATAPGQRLETAVEAQMKSVGHFDAVPADERSAAAQQAALAAAKSIDAQLTIETGDGRLSELASRGMDRLFRGQYLKVAQAAGDSARQSLSGVIVWAHLRSMQETQRHAAAGVTPPGSGPESGTGAAERPATDRAKDTRGHARD